VSKFDSKYLTDYIFARKVSSKVDVEIIPHWEEEQDVVEVFAIDKKEPSDWYRARKVIPGPSNGIADLSDVIVKTEPGEAPSHEIVDLSDVIVKIEPGEGCHGKTEVIVKVEPGELGTFATPFSRLRSFPTCISGHWVELLSDKIWF
jgi:hypothetical protein